MEALKKAEEAKRLASEDHSQEATPSAARELTLKPLTENIPSPPPGSPLPELSLHIDSVDADLAAVSTEAPSKQRAPASAARPAQTNQHDAAERTAALNVFLAKQAPKSRNTLWFFLGLGGIAILGLIIYYWWQLQGVSGGSLTRPTQAPLTAQALPPTATIQTQPLAVTEAVKPAPDPLPVPIPQALKPAPDYVPQAERITQPQKPSAAAPQAPGNDRVRLSQSQPKANQTLERAYDALQEGKLEEAQRGYEQVLHSDAKNTDALLGIATIAATLGHTEQAHAYYLRALESDPNDATAQAGLVNTRGQADPGLAESRLKTALGNQPDSPALHFALGNIYAQQARWSEAQQAYFRAYAGEPDNADFLFNLAVSLDHLHQNKLAAQYYQMALKTAETNGAKRNTSFDRIQVKARILELHP